MEGNCPAIFKRKNYMGSWTEKEDEYLLSLIKEGYSFSRIADLMGCTRNAVAGRTHRLKQYRSIPKVPVSERKTMAKKATTLKEKVPVKRKSTSITRKKKPMVKTAVQIDPQIILCAMEQAEDVEIVIKDEIEVPGCLLINLEDHQCKFAIGEDHNKRYRFCGAKTKENSKYCPEHHAKCHNKVLSPIVRKIAV